MPYFKNMSGTFASTAMSKRYGFIALPLALVFLVLAGFSNTYGQRTLPVLPYGNAETETLSTGVRGTLVGTHKYIFLTSFESSREGEFGADIPILRMMGHEGDIFRWTARLDEGTAKNSGGDMESTLVDDKSVYIAPDNGYIYRFRLRDGEEIWRSNINKLSNSKYKRLTSIEKRGKHIYASLKSLGDNIEYFKLDKEDGSVVYHSGDISSTSHSMDGVKFQHQGSGLYEYPNAPESIKIDGVWKDIRGVTYYYESKGGAYNIVTDDGKYFAGAKSEKSVDHGEGMQGSDIESVLKEEEILVVKNGENRCSIPNNSTRTSIELGANGIIVANLRDQPSNALKKTLDVTMYRFINCSKHWSFEFETGSPASVYVEAVDETVFVLADEPDDENGKLISISQK
jgi:hypothetical protein